MLLEMEQWHIKTLRTSYRLG